MSKTQQHLVTETQQKLINDDLKLGYTHATQG